MPAALRAATAINRTPRTSANTDRRDRARLRPRQPGPSLLRVATFALAQASRRAPSLSRMRSTRTGTKIVVLRRFGPRAAMPERWNTPSGARRACQPTPECTGVRSCRRSCGTIDPRTESPIATGACQRRVLVRTRCQAHRAPLVTPRSRSPVAHRSAAEARGSSPEPGRSRNRPTDRGDGSSPVRSPSVSSTTWSAEESPSSGKHDRSRNSTSSMTDSEKGAEPLPGGVRTITQGGGGREGRHAADPMLPMLAVGKPLKPRLPNPPILRAGEVEPPPEAETVCGPPSSGRVAGRPVAPVTLPLPRVKGQGGDGPFPREEPAPVRLAADRVQPAEGFEQGEALVLFTPEGRPGGPRLAGSLQLLLDGSSEDGMRLNSRRPGIHRRRPGPGGAKRTGSRTFV
jgi:hypothetical protein